MDKIKRHYVKELKLDNCQYLKEIKLIVPQELLCVRDFIKDDFFKIDKFYSRFFVYCTELDLSSVEHLYYSKY